MGNVRSLYDTNQFKKTFRIKKLSLGERSGYYEVNVYNLGKKKYLGKYATLDEAKKVRNNYLQITGKSYIKGDD